jgi:hypothetical protein
MRKLLTFISVIILGAFGLAWGAATIPTVVHQDHLMDQRGNVLSGYWVGYYRSSDTTLVDSSSISTAVDGYTVTLPSDEYLVYVAKHGSADTLFEKRVTVNVPLDDKVRVGGISDHADTLFFSMAKGDTIDAAIKGNITGNAATADHADSADNANYAHTFPVPDSAVVADSCHKAPIGSGEQYFTFHLYDYNLGIGADRNLGSADYPIFKASDTDTLTMLKLFWLGYLSAEAQWKLYLKRMGSGATIAVIPVGGASETEFYTVTAINETFAAADTGGFYIEIVEESGTANLQTSSCWAWCKWNNP